MIQSQELLQLQAHHVRGLQSDLVSVLMLRLQGSSVASIQDQLHRSRASVYRDLERVSDAVFLPLGLSPGAHSLGYWAASHTSCCLSEPAVARRPLACVYGGLFETKSRTCFADITR
jgi:hypothetical protein